MSFPKQVTIRSEMTTWDVSVRSITENDENDGFSWIIDKNTDFMKKAVLLRCFSGLFSVNFSEFQWILGLLGPVGVCTGVSDPDRWILTNNGTLGIPGGWSRVPTLVRTVPLPHYPGYLHPPHCTGSTVIPGSSASVTSSPGSFWLQQHARWRVHLSFVINGVIKQCHKRCL